MPQDTKKDSCGGELVIQMTAKVCISWVCFINQEANMKKFNFDSKRVSSFNKIIAIRISLKYIFFTFDVQFFS